MWVWEGFYLEDPCELTFANTLLLSNAAISLGNAFINLEISSEYIIFFTLWSFFLSSLFISLQIKEFRILALSINDSLYSSLFFFLTGLHFFHLSIGLILLIYFWCSRSSFTSSGWRLVTLTSILPRLRRTKWGETNGRNWEMIDRRVTRLVWCFVSLRLLPSVRSALRSSLNPRSLPPLGFSHFTRSPHGVSEVRHEPREGREVGERYGHSRRLRLSRSLLSPRLFPPLSIPALSLPSFFRSERAAGEWREGKRREERELNGKLSHVPGLTHRFHAPITSARRMFVPGSLVTSLTLHSHPRSRGERSGSERSEKERNEPREMGTTSLVLSMFYIL